MSENRAKEEEDALEDALDTVIREAEDYLGRTPALADGRALEHIRKLAAAARIVTNSLSEAQFIIREARIACPLCRGKGYWSGRSPLESGSRSGDSRDEEWSTDVYKNRPCHCKAGELYSAMDQVVRAARGLSDFIVDEAMFPLAYDGRFREHMIAINQAIALPALRKKGEP